MLTIYLNDISYIFGVPLTRKLTHCGTDLGLRRVVTWQRDPGSLRVSTSQPDGVGAELGPADGAARLLDRVARRKLALPSRRGDALAGEARGIVGDQPADRRTHDLGPEHLVARPA